MSKIAKLLTNFDPRAGIANLGLAGYGTYMLSAIASIPQIVRRRNLQPVDKAMSGRTTHYKFAGKPFVFDCGYCDRVLQENSYGFGIVREIYLRNVYFRHLPANAAAGVRTVLDLGANRGAFSAMMTTCAQTIVAVEAQPQYGAVIRHNLELNQFSNYKIEQVLVGAQGILGGSGYPQKTIDEILDAHQIEQVDLVKMDIEGSEFALFDQADWLRRVRMMAMEIHPQFGDPREIEAILKQRGFTTLAADEEMALQSDPRNATFMYAWRQ